jgi:LPXTG-motif cell wall-anchored protein
MRPLVLLAALYAVIAALVLPSSLLASEAGPPAPSEPAEPAPAAEPPAGVSGQPAATPGQPAGAPGQPSAAPEDPALTPDQPALTPGEPAAAPGEPAAASGEPAAAPVSPASPAQGRNDRSSARAAASAAVTIADFQFTPAQITVDQGDTVTWTNNGPTAHSATAPDGSFDTGILQAGQSASHSFDQPGTFSYICTPHPNMHGTIVVRASQTGADTPDSNAGEGGGSGNGGSAGTGSSGAEAAQTDGGPSLPNTGSDTGALLVLGALMLLLGVAVRRRARAEQPRAAGRIGW